MQNSLKEMTNGLASLGNRADQIEERISDIEDRNLEMMQMDKKRDFRVKKERKNSTRNI